jgi:hypothetical protein
MAFGNQNALGAPTLNKTENKANSSRFPMAPRTGNISLSFPSDLIKDSRNNFYSQIQFVQYERPSVFNAPFLRPLGSICLPLPKKINDVQTVTWEAVEGGIAAAAIEGFSEGDIAGAVENVSVLGATGAVNLLSQISRGATGFALQGVQNAIPIGLQQFGYAVNPFLTMLFKSGNFKEHTLQWTFTPNRQEESNNLMTIINYFKANMLPTYRGPLLGYPNILLVDLYPVTDFTFKFKPCAVSAVSVDYSGGGTPSFFRDGTPTIVNLAVQLKEIELWSQNDYTNL